MKIYTTSDLTIPCQWATIAKAGERLGHYLNCESKIISFENLRRRRIDRDSDEVLFIFEAGNPQHAGLSLRDMKWYFPNSKFVALSSDAIFYLKRGADQVDLSLCNLFLEVSDIPVKAYRDRGFAADTWVWSISEWLINFAEGFRKTVPKDTDFIGVYHPGTLSTGYRKRMVDYLRDAGLSFTNGGGNGHHDNDLKRLMSHYARSWFALGTTSHTDPDVHGVKGFRDGPAAFTDTLLIYDNYREVLERFCPDMPIYGYGNFAEIVAIAKYFRENETHRELLLERQRRWYTENTIEQQLLSKLKEYEII